jgi:hypothetical protein
METTRVFFGLLALSVGLVACSEENSFSGNSKKPSAAPKDAPLKDKDGDEPNASDAEDSKEAPASTATADAQGDTAAGPGTAAGQPSEATAEEQEIKKITASLDNLRWSLPCQDPADGRKVCDGPKTVNDTKVLDGDAKTLFNIKLRFRGIVEPKTYSGGQNDGAYWQIGGTPGGDAWNIYKLEISNPRQEYYLNRAESTGFVVYKIDYEKTLQAHGGATVTITADTRDARQIGNFSNFTIPGVEDTAYNGQFIQINVVEIKAQQP